MNCRIICAILIALNLTIFLLFLINLSLAKFTGVLLFLALLKLSSGLPLADHLTAKYSNSLTRVA